MNFLCTYILSDCSSEDCAQNGANTTGAREPGHDVGVLRGQVKGIHLVTYQHKVKKR